METTCPLCGFTHANQDTDFGVIYKCTLDRCYHISEGMFFNLNKTEAEQRLNAIYNFTENLPFNSKNGSNYYWKFYYDERDPSPDNDCLINVYRLMKDYPFEIISRIDKILINLAKKFCSLSSKFSVEGILKNYFRLFYCESNDRIEELKSMFSFLSKFNYIEIANTHGNPIFDEYRISGEGWKRIATQRRNSVKNQGFIAMSFDSSLEYIQKAFETAISQAGYISQIIKDKEHNNYIMPEIFYEISVSKFIVVDITAPNLGAYYEAGYAQALDKEVIVCCKKDIFDDPKQKPHFDIAQKSMIIWVDEKDLIERLKKRIQVTIK